MKSLGDFDLSTVIYGKFTTFRPSTGAAYTLAGTPALSVYKDNSTTQSTTGVTLTADFDAVTGLNHFAIDTSADGTFYSSGSFFDIVITTGTVDSVSVVGAVVASFTLRKNSALKPTTAARTLDVSAGGEAGIDWANVGSPTTTLALTGTTIASTQKVDIETIKTNPVVNAGTVTFPTTATLASTTNITAGTVTTATNVTTVNGLTAGVITAASIAADAITAAKIATGAIDADALAADAVTEIWAGSTAPSAATIADAVWDEDATAHQTQGTFGQAIGDPGADTDTIWALVNTNLDAAVSSRMATYTQPTGFLAATFPTTVASTTNITAGTITTATNVTTVNGLAAGVITATSIASDAFTAAKFAADCITAAKIADGAIDRATFAADTGLQAIRSGTAQAGAAGTITLDASASSTTNFYRGCLIYLTGGTGVGQVEACFSYDGTTKVATMWKNWKTTPDNTTTFAVLPSYTAGVSTSLYAASDLLSISGTAGGNVSGLSSLGTAYGAGTLTTNITGTLSTVTTLTNLPAITSNWLTAAGLAADAVAEIADGVWDEVQSGHTTAGTFGKYLDAQVSTVGGGTAASIADAVWDEVLSGHLTAGSTGYALNAAGSAGDPWSTSLPGSYTGTTAGFIIGTMRAATFAVQFPIISDDNSFEMVIGDDYYAADGRNLSFSIGATPSLSGATVRFKIQLTEDDAGYTTSNTYTSTTGTVSGSSTQVMSFDVPGTTTDDMSEGWHDYEVEATLSSGHVTTLVRGRVNALSQVV